MKDLLTLTQWLSPAFPLGSFAYSHGLEWAIDIGEVTDPGTFQNWLHDIIDLGAGRADATLLSLTHRGRDAAEMADLARALAPSRERWEEAIAQGTAFADTLSALTGKTHPPMALPVAVGLAARNLSLATDQVAALYLHSFASNLASVAQRAVPIGQNAGQRVLSELHPLITQIASWAATAQADDITTTVPRADLAAAAHETMEVRIFRT